MELIFYHIGPSRLEPALVFVCSRMQGLVLRIRYFVIPESTPTPLLRFRYGASRAKDIPETEVLSLEAGAILTSIVVYCFNWTAYIIRCDVAR